MSYCEEITQRITEEITTFLKGKGVVSPEVVLDRPVDFQFGDVACNGAMRYAKELAMNPRALADELIASLQEKNLTGVASYNVAGPGFINVRFTREFYTKALQELLTKGERYGANQTNDGVKTIVEYTDPNPFKEFHIGHLMSNTIGESVARLMEYTGATVKRANYQGDVGRHVACAIWGMMQKNERPRDAEQMGQAYTFGATAFKNDENAKQEIIAINKAIYDKSDDAVNAYYDEGRQKSLEAFERIYELLGTKFDYYFFESAAGPYGKELVRNNTENGVFNESDGAIVYEGEKEGLHTRVFINSEGLPTYEAKELGLAKLKYDEFSYDRSLIVTASEINEYFKVLLSAMRHIWPELAEKTTHIGHGMLRLSSGKMSSSKGNVVTGESLVRDMQERVRARMQERGLSEEETSDAVDAIAVASVKYSVLRQSTGKHITFDPEASLSTEGDSGPYLQYAHARACSVIRKAQEEGIDLSADGVVTEEVADIERLLQLFPEVVLRAQQEFEPHYITTYITELAGTFNSWYAHTPIVDKDDTTSPYKIALTQAFAQTMKNGLWLLGMRAPERM